MTPSQRFAITSNAMRAWQSDVYATSGRPVSFSMPPSCPGDGHRAVCIGPPSVAGVRHRIAEHGIHRSRDRSSTMRIGILGTGSMAATLGGAWARAGHQVLVGGRDRAAAAAAAGVVGAAGHGGLADAAAYGDVVLAAVPADAAPELTKHLAETLAGRTVIDCTNPVAPTDEGLMLTTGGMSSVARRMADAAPGAHVVKAFNLCHESIWTLPRPEFEDAALAVPYCADDAGAREQVAALITSMGCTPLPCGGLARAAYLEATAAFAIGAWWSGAQARFAFPTPGQAGV
ncbi:NAD(P)-binding domain-containing protein [Streptomyces sp. NPDC051907]|uniref:NADPH-dependent F420 reductase n=1 Tax=Streptomyces sp. NPDC051907 TaxID=3155284 RepID=UPI00343574F3